MTDRDPETGRFLPGNKFWEARSSHGRNPIFATPDNLWDAACQYFEWVEDKARKIGQAIVGAIIAIDNTKAKKAKEVAGN